MRRLAACLALALLAAPGCSLLAGERLGIAALEEGPAGEVASGFKAAGWLAGAPLSVALAPVAGLLWATPWVDLALAVDIAGAPIVGLGYAFEAVGGGAAWALLGWAGPLQRWLAPPAGEGEPALAAGRPRLSPAGPALPGLPLARWRRREPARPPAPLGDEDARRYAVDPAQVAALASALAASAARGDAPVVARVDGPFAATLELSLSPEAGPRPLVLLTPPVEATFAARWMAERYARRGVHAAVLAPDVEFLEPRLDAPALEAKLAAAVRAARGAVHALAAREDVERVRYLGVSAGGIFGAILVGVEPKVGRAALLLPGGDLPSIVATSEEPGVVAYREAWAARGVPPRELERRLRAHVRTDPVRLAAHVDPARVLLFLGAGDTLVPIQTGLLLHDALGEPDTWLLAGNHDTACLAFGWLLREADRFLLEAP